MMRPLSLGPVELDVVALDSDRPSPGLLRAVAAQIDAGAVRVADFVIVSKSSHGVVSVTEVDADEYGLAGVDLLVQGLTASDDLEGFAAAIAPGTSAAVIAFELAWAAQFADELSACGGDVVATARIPATAVNAVLEIAIDEDTESIAADEAHGPAGLFRPQPEETAAVEARRPGG